MSIRRQTGFTLVEIMIAVAILAIISAIAIPLYQGYVTEARFGTAMKDIRQMQLILDDLASDNDLMALDGNSTAERGAYMGAGGNLVLDDPGTTPGVRNPGWTPGGASIAISVLRRTVRTTCFEAPVQTRRMHRMMSTSDVPGSPRRNTSRPPACPNDCR